ncbi:uncharacterized protein LOC144150206 [Haemaphysalis longicornis]
MAVRRASVGGANDETDHDTQGLRSTGTKRRTITFDELKLALTSTREPFTSPLSCTWLFVVLISLIVTVTVVLSLCYAFKKGRPPLPTGPPVIQLTPTPKDNKNVTTDTFTSSPGHGTKTTPSKTGAHIHR